MTTKILNFGGGVNSAALLALLKQGKLEADYLIFADPGAEHPETYQWTEDVAKPTCKELGIEFVTVTGKYGNIYEHYFNKTTFPFRKTRDCSAKFKIRPIHKWIKENTDMDVIQYLGIAYDEKHRAIEGTHFPIEYPLVDMKITRKTCKKIIEAEGWPMPVRSGCFICPFTTRKKWKWLFDTHPDLFTKAEAMEKNCRTYPKNTFDYRITLEDLRLRRDDNTLQASLLDCKKEDGCVICHS